MRPLGSATVWLMLLAGTACRGTAPEPPPSVYEEKPMEHADEAAGGPDEGRTSPSTSPVSMPAEAAAFVEASNAFGIDLYRRVAERRGNLALSPASVSLAFALTSAGARGETASEMRRVLRMEGTDGAVHASARHLIAAWNDPNRKEGELRVVSRLFGERAFAFVPAFVKLARESYDAPLDAANFRDAADRERRRINAWVGEQTRERIRDVLPEGSVDRLTRLLIVNAVYFLGQWMHVFERDDTADELFHPAGGKPRPWPMMRQTRFHRYAEVDGVQVLEMAYRGEDLAMTLVLPAKGESLGSVERSLTPERVTRWVDALDRREVRVFLPRFEIQDAGLDLGAVLPGMGMKLAFDRERADFSGMAPAPRPEDKLYISGAFHRAVVTVDEVGTEAAAATVIVMGAAGGPPPAPPVFRADRPFLFLIRHLSSGAILFLGRVHDPAA